MKMININIFINIKKYKFILKIIYLLSINITLIYLLFIE